MGRKDDIICIAYIGMCGNLVASHFLVEKTSEPNKAFGAWCGMLK